MSKLSLFSLLTKAFLLSSLAVSFAPLAFGQSTNGLVANPDSANVAEGASVTIDVLDNDIAPSGASIETNVSPYAGKGWLRVDQDAGTIRYTPYVGQSGTDTFSYRLRVVGTGVSAPTTVAITIGDTGPVTPNAAPQANAGSNQTVSTGQSVTLNGSGSRDTDGSIVSYVWSNGGTQVGTGANTTLSGLSAGTYTISLLVTDDDGATDTDSVTVTVNDAPASNIAPIANAGNNQTITESQSVTLNAGSSSDSDGSIVSYSWSENGVTAGSTQRLTLSNLSVGTHTIRLTVTDDDGATDTDTVEVTVNASGGGGGGTGPLVANPDTATVPEGGSVTINVLSNDTGTTGAQIETNVSPYASSGWLRVDQTAGTIRYTPYIGRSGTDSFSYRLRIPGTGVSAPTTVTVTIGNSYPVTPNVAPQADAGSNQTVTNGQNVNLNGSGSSDSDGNIASYVWSNGGTQLSTVANPVLRNLGTGIYNITLLVTDNDGATDTDTVVVTVSAVPVSNEAPTANAGPNQTIQTGNSVTLNASGSSDSDGNIVRYVWRENGSQVGTGQRVTLNNLSSGRHPIDLTITDDDGAKDTDRVVISVNDAPVVNASPVADAGNDQTIQEGEPVTLNGGGSSDNDGNIVSYSWRENGLEVGTQQLLTLSSLGAGTHTISLTVTDNDGATDTDNAVVTVTAGSGGGALQALADEATVEIKTDGSARVAINFAANDLGNFNPDTFYIAQYGTDGTDAKGWINASEKANGVVYYNPYTHSLLNPTTDYFTYGIRDAQGNRSEALVTINLLPPAPPAGCDAVGSRNKTISVALVGNSLMNEIQQKLTQLLVCKGFTSEMGTSNPGGYWLYLHDTNQQTADLIARGFDLTLIQEQSSGITTHSPPYDIISSLNSKIEAAGSQMGLYQTWGLQDREPVKTEAIMSGYETIANYFNAPIVHIGRAWDYFYTLHSESPPFSLYVDYAHPTQQGKALISYVLYAYLTGESPVDTPILGIAADEALLLQTVAWDSYQANR